MKLNYDLSRNLLLKAENKKTTVLYHNQNQIGLLWNIDILLKNLKRLEEADYIDVTIRYALNKVYIYEFNNITWEGHQFLDIIRSNKVLGVSKKVANELKIKSVYAFSQIVIQVLSNLINKYLSLK